MINGTDKSLSFFRIITVNQAYVEFLEMLKKNITALEVVSASSYISQVAILFNTF